MTFDQLLDDFAILDNWEDRYRYVIELGRNLPPFDDADRNGDTKVDGCVSQVWLKISLVSDQPAPALTFTGDSDAHIVRGLIAVLISLFSGKPASEIVAINAPAELGRLGLDSHLTQQRSNGLTAMVNRIQGQARQALAK